MSLFIPAQVAINKPASTASWSPSDLPDLYAWFDAQETSTITKDGDGLVSQWNDRTANACNLTVTSGKEPTYSSSAFNSKAGITFTSGKYLNNATNNGLDFLRAQGKVTIVMVMYHVSRNSSRAFMYWSKNGADNYTRLSYGDYNSGRISLGLRQLDSNSRYDDNSSSSYPIALTTGIIVRFQLDFSTRYPRIYTNTHGDTFDIENATQLATTDSFSDTRSNKSYLGGDGTNATNSAEFKVGELLWIRDTLTSDEITNLNSYLKTKWGI